MVQTSKGRDWYTVEINTAASMDVTFVCVHTALVHRTRDFPFSPKRRHCTDCFVPYLHTKPLRPELMLSGFSAFSAMLYAVLFSRILALNFLTGKKGGQRGQGKLLWPSV